MMAVEMSDDKVGVVDMDIEAQTGKEQSGQPLIKNKPMKPAERRASACRTKWNR
jgi:hypothetical protein